MFCSVGAGLGGFLLFHNEYIWTYLPGAVGVPFIVGLYQFFSIFFRDDPREKAAKEKANQEKLGVIEQAKQKAFTIKREGFDGILIGNCNGFFKARGHVAAMTSGLPAFIPPADVCKNIWIAGGIGSGKTASAINVILFQILNQDCSGLVFDIKGDFRRELDHIAGWSQREYTVIGDGGKTLNLFRGITPEVAASFLKSCFIASGSSSGDGAFWADTATNYCRNLLQLIQLAGEEYSIAGLADLVFSADRRQDALAAARKRELAGEFDKRTMRIWAATLSYMVETVENWDDKFRGNVQGTCEAVLNPFIHPDLVDAFSTESAHGEANLYDLLNEKSLFLVNLPRAKFGVNGARYAYLLIKLRFMTMMAERRSRPELNQDRYVAFFCDEYQGIVDAISDTDFWDKSRSSRCFGVVSMQGYSSLIQAVGDEKAAAAIFQNWRQRLIFRTEDQATIELAQRLLGEVDVHIKSGSSSTSTSTSSGAGQGAGGKSVSNSYSESTSIQRQSLFAAQEFRGLPIGYALFIGNIDGRASDDVLTTFNAIVE